MHPRVEYRDGGSDDLCGWGLFRAISIEHVVLSLLAKHIVACFEELCDKIDCVLSELLLILITLLDLTLLVIV